MSEEPEAERKTTEAQRRASQRYRERNRETVLETNRKYKKSSAGLAAQAEANRRWREKNPDKVEEYRLKYQQPASPKKDRRAELLELVGAEPDLSRLDGRQRTIITLYYGLEGNEPLSDPKIGELFGCSRQNINQERKRALAALTAST